jgi:hypothetical protein
MKNQAFHVEEGSGFKCLSFAVQKKATVIYARLPM